MEELNDIDQKESLETAIKKLIPIEMAAIPSDPNNELSPWITLPKNVIKIVKNFYGQNEYKSHEGVNSGGANGVYFIEISDILDQKEVGIDISNKELEKLLNIAQPVRIKELRIKNVLKGMKKKYPKVETLIEDFFIYPMIKSKNVRRWKLDGYNYIIQMQNPITKVGFDESFVRINFPKTYSYFDSFRRILSERKTKVVRQLVDNGSAFYTMYGVGEYTYAPFKVVWNQMGKKLTCCVISTINDKYLGEKLILPEHVLAFMEFYNKLEAHYVCAIMNSSIDSLEKELQDKFDEIDLVFRTFFSNYPRVVLKDHKLLSGLKVVILKNKFIRREGSYLPYTLIQGVVLSNINKIMDELKKSIKTQVAAEFNTPLNLQNQFIVGNTINTEFCREEIPFGFKLDQVRNLFISGGTNSQRDNIAMKIISELVKSEIPSIIFDFKGNYSKIINSFSKTQFKNNFHYFKLGQSFQISLLKSDIENDIDNTKYLDYVYECLGMVFKLDDKAILDLKKEIKLLDLEVKSLELNDELKKAWEKNRKLEQSMSKLTEFLDLTRSTISALGLPEGVITSEDFLKDGKTVIIDLSLLRPPYNLFGMFVIISKIIRYIEEFEDFQSKILVMPNIEYFFDKYYLDRWIKSPIIDLFLDPLAEKGFGFLFLVNEINKLHPSVYDYLENFIALKTVNSYDFQVLKNLFNLQEIQGQGYYTNKRKNTYQIDFLKQLREDMAIVKRDDYDQPFPVKFRLDKIKNLTPLQYEELISYMRQFGYDFQKTEKQIKQSLRKTFFQKDFEGYYYLIDEIKNFLRTLKVTDNIAGIDDHRLKKSLFKFIYNKLASKNYKKKEIIKVRNDLFNLLLRHQYIIESHPRTAGNTESLRTNYRVGPQYDKALEDEINPIQPFKVDVDMEPIELNNNGFESVLPKKKEVNKYWNPSDYDQKEKHEIEIDEKQLNYNKNIPWVKLVGGFLIPDTARVGTKIKNKNYKEAIMAVKSIIPEFLYKLYNLDFKIRSKKTINAEDLEKSIDFIENCKIIPFTRQELYEILKKISITQCRPNELKEVANKFYKMLYNFSQKVLIELL